MKPIRDPENSELKHLLQACTLSNKAVLEIGCGDGVVTRQYSRLTHRTIGFDPISSELQKAVKKNSSRRSTRAYFLQAKGEALPFLSQSFEVALFASSL